MLHLAKFYPPERGGMERVLQTICEATEGAVDNTVLAAHTRWRTTRDRVGAIPVVRAGRIAQWGSVAVCPTFPYWQRRLRADLAVVHEPNALALVGDWVTASRSPVIVWFHADLVRPSWQYDWLYRPLLDRVLVRAARVIVSSPRLASSAVGLDAVRHKCEVVPFGIDPSPYARPKPRPSWLEAFCARASGPVALTVGRLVRYKGVDVLIRAVASTNLSLVIVGSGPQLGPCRELARELGVADRVLFAGTVSDDDLVATYQAADIFVLASVSRQETFGMVQLEAMTAGKPVVNTDLPTGVPWVSRHQETGLTVRPGHVHSLAAALRTLADDAALRVRLGAAGRARVEREFTVEQVRTRVLDVYRRVATETRALRRASSSPHDVAEESA